MSRQPVTILTCEQCGTELRVASEDPAYVAGWSTTCGWCPAADLCPDCLVAGDRQDFDAMFANVLAAFEGD